MSGSDEERLCVVVVLISYLFSLAEVDTSSMARPNETIDKTTTVASAAQKGKQ
jgi:hypothetical protein